jgi:hypothetical protein
MALPPTDPQLSAASGGTNSGGRKRTLLEIARERAQKLESSARNGIPVDLEELEQIEGLYKLDLIRQRQTRTWGRWVVAIVLLGLLAATVVLKTRVWWATEVELDLRVSGFRATSTAVQDLWDGVVVSEATLQPVREVRPSPELFHKFTLGPDDLGPSNFVSVIAPDSAGSVQIGRVQVNTGEGFALQAGADDSYRVSVDSVVSPDVTLGLQGPAVVQAGKLSSEVPSDSIRSVTVLMGAGTTNLRIVPSARTEGALLQHLRVRDLAFEQVRRRKDEVGREVPAIVSTVLGGQVVFPGIGGLTRRVSPLETLGFGGVEGTVHSARIADDGIHLAFVGKARTISMGAIEITPTLFEYLVARDDWRLLWGVGAYLVVLVASLRNWWRGI